MSSFTRCLATAGALALASLPSGCATMVVEGVGEALTRTVAEGIAIEVAAQAACRASEPPKNAGTVVCGADQDAVQPPQNPSSRAQENASNEAP
jgi:hypothetical protein